MPVDIATWFGALVVAALGVPGGFAVGRWAVGLTPLADEPAGSEAFAASSRRAVWGSAVATAALFFTFVVMLHGFGCQRTPEVQPDAASRHLRIAYHLALVSLLVAATVTDLRDYLVPDEITLPGIALGLVGAALSGDLQIIHLWVDWQVEVPGLRGPEIPEWIRAHRHWHGLAVSLAGMAAGAGVTSVVRWASGGILGREALGFGDVTLMAMIGAFVGWQPVIVAFALAPLCALLFGVLIRLAGGKSYLPYGPWLAAATVVVLLTWRWIWMFEIAWSPTSRFALRRFFSDGVGLAIVGVAAVVTMVVLLGLLRLYRAAPIGTKGNS